MHKINEFAPSADRHFVLGCPTGGTPVPVYKKLVEFHKAGLLDFQHVTTFNMDEYCNLPESHPESYHTFMWENLFKHINIDPKNVHILNGNAPNLVAECDEYERKIEAAGGIDLFMAGIGPDGHIAFNEPGSSLVSKTRVKTLAYDTIVANARFFDNDLTKVPRMALTVGVDTVMSAKEIVLLVTGSNKSLALYKAVEEGVSHMWTCSALQMHPNSMIVCDDDATLELKVKTVKYFKGLMQVTQGFSDAQRAALVRPRGSAPTASGARVRTRLTSSSASGGTTPTPSYLPPTGGAAAATGSGATSTTDQIISLAGVVLPLLIPFALAKLL